MTCKNCGAAVSANDKYCPVCGVPTAEKKKPNFCIHCGKKLAPNDRFCPGCGWEIGEPKPTVTDPKNNISASRLYYKPRRKVLDIKAVILVTLLLLSAAVFLTGTLLEWWQL